MSGARGSGQALLDTVRGALAGIVEPAMIRLVEPTLEDVFVLRSEEHGEEAA